MQVQVLMVEADKERIHKLQVHRFLMQAVAEAVVVHPVVLALLVEQVDRQVLVRLQEIQVLQIKVAVAVDLALVAVVVMVVQV
tara:strand:+ start:246 stop:494 length:249 start_codon:yes stop_codon:yes gene_type:complete